MALTVKDVLELPSGQRMQLLAGGGGLNRPVISVEIADYEFAPDIDFVPEAGFDPENAMEPASFIITSFLFAKDDPALILSAVQALEEMGMAGLAYKQIIYDQLPEEVLTFAEEKNFPLFSFSRDLWFENIIFDIMYAVQFDDKVYLSEDKIDAMLSGRMNRSELDIIRKGISLKLRTYVTVVFIPGDGLDAGRILRSFYMLKGFHSKGLMLRYGDSLFLITTSPRSDAKSHDLIRKEAFELLGIDRAVGARSSAAATGAGGAPESAAATGPNGAPCSAAMTGMSDVHESAELDRAFRESWLCYVASAAEDRQFRRFSETGVYRVLLPALDNRETPAFAESLTGAFADNPDLTDTVSTYVSAGGDTAKTASALHCHQNTVRYRLGRIRDLTGLQDATDAELFLQLKTALAITRAKAVIASGR